MFAKKGEQKKNISLGFTLIEVLIVIVIVSIIAAISIISWQSFSDEANLGNTAKMIESKIKLAKSYTLSATNDVNYGIHLDAGNVTIYPANLAYDPLGSNNQIFPLTQGVEIYNGVGNDIVFNRLTGITSNAGTIGVRIISRPSKIKTITINSQGQTGTEVFEASAVSEIMEDPGHGINSRHIHFNLSAWSIQNYDTLRLEWTGTGVAVPVTKDIDMSSHFNADKSSFDWEGSETVDSTLQTLRIHTLSMDASSALICVIRDRMKNNESLNIYFIQGATVKRIATYTEEAAGTVSVLPNYTFVDNPVSAQ